MQANSIIDRLKNDYGLKAKGAYLREGTCPECGKKELFISATEPHHLKCGREDKCNWGAKTRDLYPDLWRPLHELHPPTPADPNATAKAYLRTRSLDPALFAGLFQQGQRVEHKAIREPKHTETVRFFLNPEKSITWERYLTVIDMADKPKKAHFTGSYKGLWWTASDLQNIVRGERVFMVEGILDAMSLHQSGFKAVALLSCYNWPEKSLQAFLGKGIKWTLGLDNDKAGQRYNHKFYRELVNLGEQAEVCTAPDKDKRDWNDLLKELNGKISMEDLREWFYTGRLMTAGSAKAKALEIVGHTGRHRFTFDYQRQLFAAQYKEDEEEPIKTECIANCKPDFVYFQKDAVTGEGAYFVRVERPGVDTVYKDVMPPSAIASAAEFKQKLMNSGVGLMFTGTTKQLEKHQIDYWFNNTATLPEVKTVNFLGYSKELKGWIFPNQAVFNGQLHQVNTDEFFDLPDGRQVKTSFRLDTVNLGTVEEAHRPDLWLEDFKSAFGVKGLAALTFWTGSFFAEHIRAMHQSYPFLELSGEPGTGKTTLLEFLWKLSGRENYEGVELSKASHAGRWRTLEQLANLPLVLMEGDRSSEGGKQRNTFDLNEAKGLYNGRGMRAVGVRNGGNETKEPPFRGSVIIAQNAPVESERAVMERIVRVHWDKSHFSTNGYHASNRLRALDLEQINGFMTACITQEKRFLDLYQQGYEFAMQRLEGDRNLVNQRIRHNHAQLMAIGHALKASGILSGLLPDDLEAIDRYLKQCCADRHNCLDADTPLLAEFWDMFHYLEHETDTSVNHSRDPGRVAISLNQFFTAAEHHKQPKLDMVQLRRELKQSKRYPFLEQVPVWSVISQKTVKCYVFQNKEGRTEAKAA